VSDVQFSVYVLGTALTKHSNELFDDEDEDESSSGSSSRPAGTFCGMAPYDIEEIHKMARAPEMRGYADTEKDNDYEEDEDDEGNDSDDSDDERSGVEDGEVSWLANH
jgi:hypothetical protein